MRKRTFLILTVLALASGVVLAQVAPAADFLQNGFQFLFYHAVRLEETLLRRDVNLLALASDEFTKAVQDPSQRGEALLMLGLIYSSLQRPGTALGYYLDFAYDQPEDPWVHALIGELYAEMGLLDQAEESFRLAIQASPEGETWARAHYGLGSVALERGEYPAAKAEFELAVAAADSLVEARLGLGRALYYLGEYEGAIETLELAQLLAPRSISILEQLALAYEAAGRAEQAAHVSSRLEELRRGN